MKLSMFVFVNSSSFAWFPLSTLPGKQLSRLHTLEKLVIAHNSAPIWADAFIDMPKLHYLDLSSNRIRLKPWCTSFLIGTPQIGCFNCFIFSISVFYWEDIDHQDHKNVPMTHLWFSPAMMKSGSWMNWWRIWRTVLHLFSFAFICGTFKQGSPSPPTLSMKE